MLSKWQKAALTRLLDQYERSKTYRGENQVRQTFSLEPQRVFAEYNSDYADVNLVHTFEGQMKKLEQMGFVSIQWNGHEIERLIANTQKWDEAYRVLGRKERRRLEKEQIALYQGFMGIHELLSHFCEDQVRRLTEGKKAKFALEEAEKILKLCKFLLENQEELLERELSVAVLGDSKLWGLKYRSKVCRLLKAYGNFDELLLGVDEEREAEKILLEEFHVASNPSYVYLKGNAALFFEDGQKLHTDLQMPVAFTEKTFGRIKKIEIESERVMTVENLTSFNRLERSDSFYIFLSGYHNRLKQRLLCKIYEQNPSLEWRHFGDIDPDGFYIIEHLKRGTGIPFEPFYMEAAYLKKYSAYAKPLEENDIRKAKSLLSLGKYCEVMEYMLREGRKLEQEIISWMER